MSPNRWTRRLLALSWLWASLACSPFKLDPFLYAPERVDHYVLDPSSDLLEETVAADRIEPVTLQTSDGLTLGAAYVRANTSPPIGYALYFHGKGGTLDSASAFGRVKRYANLGYDTLGFDYRGWGTSSNVPPSEAGIDLDGKAALAYLASRAGGRAKIFYAGLSFGTAPATQRALEDPPRCLIIEAGFSSLAEFVRESTQMDLPGSYIAKDSWDTASRLAQIHVPVLLLHGTLDDTIRPSHALLNYAAANQPKELVIIEGGGHSTVPVQMGPSAYADLIHRFVDPNL